MSFGATRDGRRPTSAPWRGYLVEPLPRLGKVLSRHAWDGFELHTIFQVSQPGCVGIGSPSVTNLAVYVRKS